MDHEPHRRATGQRQGQPARSGRRKTVARIVWAILSLVLIVAGLFLSLLASGPLGHSGNGAAPGFFWKLWAAIGALIIVPSFLLSIFSGRK